MAGGNWSAQNKVRPGVYINFKTAAGAGTAQGERGTVAIARALSWGPSGQATAIAAGEDPMEKIGYPIGAPQALFLRELFKGTNLSAGAKQILLYRLKGTGEAAASASLSEGGLTITAKYPGVRGNDLSLRISASAETEGAFTVETILDGTIMDSQTAATADQLTDNGWVLFSGAGPLEASAGLSLSGGADGTADPAAWADALTALEPYDFDILAYDGTDATAREACAAFVKRFAEEEGIYTQLVTSGAKGADSRFVINLDSGVVLDDGTKLEPRQAVWWLAGAEAGAKYSQSLTYAAYPGAADVIPPKTSRQIEEAILAGNLVLSRENGRVHIETDINALTSYTPDIGRVYRKNTTMRVCNFLANRIYQEFSQNYIGKVKNDDAGRALLQAAILNDLRTMFENGALTQRPSGEDVIVAPGEESDSVVIAVALALADAVEKIYLTVTVS